MFSSPHPSSRIHGASAPPRRRKTPGQTAGRDGNSMRSTPNSLVSAVSEIDSEMDVDGLLSIQNEVKNRAGVVFAQSEELNVTLQAHLPVEVLRALKSADYVNNPFTGDIDTKSHFCLFASTETCFVWRYAQLLPGPPTCYIFPCPSRYSEPQAPFCALVSYNVSREPGLLLLTPCGEIRFWDSVGLGLTGGEATHDSQLDLSSDELVTDLVYAEPQTFVATSDSGRLFLLSISSTDGKLRVSSHKFSLSKPTGSYFAIGAWLSGSENKTDYRGGHIAAATVTEVNEDGFEVWTCVGTNIVSWTVLHKGWEELKDVDNVQEAIFEALAQFFTGFDTVEEMDLELLDIALNSRKEPILLVSFNAGYEEESSVDTRPRRVYAVLRMTRELEVALVRTVPYDTISADKANIQPRLYIMSGGELYCVQFADVLAFVANETEYSNMLTLKSIQDRTFGCSAVEGSSEILFMNSEVLMRVDMDVERINSFNESTWRGTSIKSIMTQAILFGSNPKNPLLFTFPPDIDEESLITGAEQLSQAVLASDVEIVRPNPDLTRQIMERRERLRFLIGFINENGALGKMSQSSRQRLTLDAERLYASEQLWHMYCHRVNSGLDEHLFQGVIASYMQQTEERHHEDLMRSFFKLHVRDIASVLPYLKAHVEGNAYTMDAGDSEDLGRAAEYLLCIMLSAWSYRDTNAGVHGISGAMINAWTSSEPVVEIVLDFFNLVERRLSEAPPEAMDPVIQGLKNQLPKLASAVFRCFQERLGWLESPTAADEMGIEGDKREFNERYQQLRPIILHTLLKHGLSDQAFLLAEEYHDFTSLVDLCHSAPPFFPLSANKYADRIRDYIERYRDEFSDSMCQWYIEHAELRCLYAQGEVYGEYVDAFFARHPHPGISWVHDIYKDRWGTASQTLLSQSDRTFDLETRHAMLSIGKLAQIAESEKTSSPAEKALDDFHDGLDYISVHERIIEDLRSCLAGSKSRQSIENQAEFVLKAVAPSLKPKSYPGLHSELKANIKELLQNRALEVENLVDILTLREDKLEFGVALELVKNVKRIPDARKLSAFRTVWRRIYIHDDWPSISRTTNKTDVQLDSTYRRTALYATVKDAFLRARDEHRIDNVDVSEIVYPLEEAAKTPTFQELEGRWPGHSDDQLDELMLDYKKERERLELIGMEAIIDRVKELAMEELRSGDVSMEM